MQDEQFKEFISILTDKQGGERWRVLTPIMLSVLSGLIVIMIFILGGMQSDLDKLGERLSLHEINPDIHRSGINKVTAKIDILWNYYNRLIKGE